MQASKFWMWMYALGCVLACGSVVSYWFSWGKENTRRRRLAFSQAEVEQTAHALHLKEEAFSLHDFAKGMAVELEHGSRWPDTDVTHDDPLLTGKIALAHLREHPLYYERLERMERELEREKARARSTIQS